MMQAFHWLLNPIFVLALVAACVALTNKQES